MFCSVARLKLILVITLVSACCVASVVQFERRFDPDQFDAAVCADRWGEKGCYSSWDLSHCDKDNTAVQHVISRGLKLLLQPYWDAAVAVTADVDTFFQFVAHASPDVLGKLWFGTSKDAYTLTAYRVAYTYYHIIPGTWTLDELIKAGNVTTALGLLLNDMECCNRFFERTEDGKVLVYSYNDDVLGAAEVIRNVTLCTGSMYLRTQNFMDTLPSGADQRLGDESGITFGDNFDPGAFHSLPAFNGIMRGWCNLTVPQLFDAVDLLVDDYEDATTFRTYLHLFEPEVMWHETPPTEAGPNRPLSGTAVDIAVTWFVAHQSSMASEGVGAYGVRDSGYLLYHMLPGTFCEDDLVASGSINTLLGTAVGQDMPLYFSRDEHGQLMVTAASSMGGIHQTAQPLVNKTLQVLDQYSNCKNIIYVLQDDFFPPPFSVGQVEAPSANSTWDFISSATQQFDELVWDPDGCWKPLDIPHNGSVLSEDRGDSGSLSVAQPQEGGMHGLNGAGIAWITAVSFVAGAAAVCAVIAGVHGVRGKRRGRCEGWADPGDEKTMELSTTDTDRGKGTASGLMDYFDTVPREWVVKDVKILRKVGQGSFGVVYKAVWCNCAVAVKQLCGATGGWRKEHGLWTEEQMVALKHEVNIMADLRHPNVVQFLGVMSDPPSVVMEYCHHGSLHVVLDKAANDPEFLKQLNWRRRLLMALDAAQGMQYLHGRSDPIIHRDLKSPNLLVDKHWNVKVSDFGMSKLMDLQSVKTSLTDFNPRWNAPELYGPHGRSTTASDVYSFGIILWEILTLKEPFKDLAQPQIIFGTVQCGLRPEVPRPEELPGADVYIGVQQYTQLMQRCWAEDKEQRPCFKAIVEELGVIVVERSKGGASPLPQTSQTRSMDRAVHVDAGLQNRKNSEGNPCVNHG